MFVSVMKQYEKKMFLKIIIIIIIIIISGVLL